MANLVPARPTGALTRQDARRLDLFCKTVGKELVGAEIDEALEWCELYGANPFVKDIYFFVFDADKPAKRRVVPVLGIGLYRKIAARTRNYRPDDQAPRFVYDESLKGPLNPTGMVSCEVSVHMHSHGEWHRVTSKLLWTERAPIKEIWGEDESTGRRKPTGRFELDHKKENWVRMPETMMAKCCEADAIRKAWPNETAGSYVAEEMDSPHTIEGTAIEITEAYAAEQRLKQIGTENSLLIDWLDNAGIVPVPIGQLGDRALAWIKGATPENVKLWQERNRYALREYWARDKAGALEIKKATEAATAGG